MMNNDIIHYKKRIFLLIFIVSLLLLFVTLNSPISKIINNIQLNENSNMLLLDYDYTILFNQIKDMSNPCSNALLVINFGSFLSSTYYQMKDKKSSKGLSFIHISISTYLVLGFFSSSIILYADISSLWKICLWVIVLICLLLSKYLNNTILKDLLRHSGLYLTIYAIIITLNLYSIPNLLSVSYLCFASFCFGQSQFYLLSIFIYIALCILFVFEFRQLSSKK